MKEMSPLMAVKKQKERKEPQSQNPTEGRLLMTSLPPSRPHLLKKFHLQVLPQADDQVLHRWAFEEHSRSQLSYLNLPHMVEDTRFSRLLPAHTWFL